MSHVFFFCVSIVSFPLRVPWGRSASYSMTCLAEVNPFFNIIFDPNFDSHFFVKVNKKNLSIAIFEVMVCNIFFYSWITWLCSVVAQFIIIKATLYLQKFCCCWKFTQPPPASCSYKYCILYCRLIIRTSENIKKYVSFHNSLFL